MILEAASGNAKSASFAACYLSDVHVLQQTDHNVMQVGINIASNLPWSIPAVVDNYSKMCSSLACSSRLSETLTKFNEVPLRMFHSYCVELFQVSS